MSRTGIERLRGLYVEWLGGDYLVSLSDMIQETADQIEREHAEELAAKEAEIARLREGWIAAECGARNGWGNCNATCPLRMGEYCEDVRKVVEA